MMKRPPFFCWTSRLGLIAATCALFAFQIDICTPAAAQALPQIMLTPDRLVELVNTAKSDTNAARRLDELRHKAESLLKKPLMAHTFEVTYHGKPALMLKTSRKMLKRASVLGLAWRLWQDERYAARGRAELLAVAAFKHWNPAHFLDTADMAAAVSIGMSWLAPRLSEADVSILVEALVEKAILPGLALYDSAGAPAKGSSWIRPDVRRVHEVSAAERADHGWPVETFNWNIVCNSGLALAGLVIRNHKPELSNRLLGEVRQSIKHGMAEYEPDGGFAEGPGYWSYASRYAALYHDAVPAIMGPSFDFSNTPGFQTTGDFLLHLTGPTGLAFNFGDSEVKPNRVALAWLGSRFDRAIDTWLDSAASPGSRLAFDLLWRRYDAGKSPSLLGLPLGRQFGAIHVAAFRSAWNDKKALFAALKGGNNHGHHTHLDLGSFVLDGMGVRWAMDLGPGNYLLPGYFGRKRWDYYRTTTTGQNTLTFGDEDQALDAEAPLMSFHQSPRLSFAVADLGPAYGAAPGGIRRGLALLQGRRFLIQDEISGQRPAPVTWGMHTRARPMLNPQAPGTLVLRQDGRSLGARIVSPAGARFEIRSAQRPPPERPNEGIKKIVINVDGVANGESRRIVVVLEPGASTPPDTVKITPLADWSPAMSP